MSVFGLKFHHKPFFSSLAYTSPSTSKLVSNLPHSKSLILALYFIFNLALTLYNKSLLHHFPYPYTLTAIHALSGALGTQVLAWAGVFKPATLSRKQKFIIAAFSVLYTVNIAVSNLSLRLVTVPVVRAATPFFTILFEAFLLGARPSAEGAVALVPVVIGVALATYGDYSYTTWGFLLTLLGTILAALKAIFTSLLQSPNPQLNLTFPSQVALSSLTSKILGPRVRSQKTMPYSPPSPLYSPTPTPASYSAFLSPRPYSTLHPIHKSASRPKSRTPPPPPPLSPTYPRIAQLLPALTPLHLLHLLSPLAFVQALCLAYATDELPAVRTLLFSPPPIDSSSSPTNAFYAIFSHHLPLYGDSAILRPNHLLGMLLLLNGVLAFGLNVVSFVASGRVGALGMCVAANVKQALTILVAVTMTMTTTTTAATMTTVVAPLNAMGILVTVCGGAWFAKVEVEERRGKDHRGKREVEWNEGSRVCGRERRM